MAFLLDTNVLSELRKKRSKAAESMGEYLTLAAHCASLGRL